MRHFLAYLKCRSIHTPKLAIVRLLLAVGMLLTILNNDFSIIANHEYTRLPEYTIRHAPQRYRPFQSIDLFMMMDPGTARIIVTVILFAVMTGLLPRLTAILHAWASFSIYNYFIIQNGGDHLTFALSLLLLPICLTDRRLNQWQWKEYDSSAGNIVSNIATVAIWLQASWMYFDAFISKIQTKQWLNGTAVFYYTSHYKLGAPDWLKQINELITKTQLVRVVSWGALLLEFVLALCIFFPSRVKIKFLLPALLFHFLIIINFGLITFFIAITALLILYLDDEDVIAKKLIKPTPTSPGGS
ncbi:MAG: hypothetical protein H7257_06205 [Taibaiella sp.]|nr:hypothetical protein [Taibaiella sp.]